MLTQFLGEPEVVWEGGPSAQKYLPLHVMPIGDH